MSSFSGNKIPSLQSAIDKAGNAVDLLWSPVLTHWEVPVVQPEYIGWAKEQAAWREGVTLKDLSHHMNDLFIDGPDTLRLLKDFSANNFVNFEIGQAKQFVPVTSDGDIIVDGILMRNGEESFTLSGVPASQNWIRYQAEQGNYDVEFKIDPDSDRRKEGDPVLFRFQVTGPLAMQVIDKAFGGPVPKTKFFHSTPVSLDGRDFRALRHGMAGQPGYEFIGDFKDAAYVKEALMRAGEEFGIVHVGGKAYFTNGIESGWIPTPVPAIYHQDDLKAYREWLPAFGYEGKKPLHGSMYSTDIRDYYLTPYELGYGRSVSFTHDYHGREALERLKDQPCRKRVTYDLNSEDVAKAMGPDLDYYLSYGRYRVEIGGKQVGYGTYTANIAPLDRVLSLGVIAPEHAEPGTEVDFILGEHPGANAGADAEAGFHHIRATVCPSPYSEVARTSYRAD